jgi:erythritol kinase
MAVARQILIGLEAGTTKTTAVALTPDGCEVARAAASHPLAHAADGRAEQDQGEAWQRTAAVVRQLANRVADLARRTAALALTGPGSGAWLVDEDGDPVLPALLPPDRRAAAVVRRWRRAGLAREVATTTGCPIEPSSQSAQLAWLAACRPAALDRAATVLCGKDWLYFCCTGERASEPTAALAAFGSLLTGAYDPVVLEALGLEQTARLLPEIVDDPQRYGALGAFAATALGLLPGTPVILGPIAEIAGSLAAGLADAPILGCTRWGARACHVRPCRRPADPPAGDREAAVLRFAGSWFGLTRQAATVGPDWPLALAEQLLADAGLIGVPRGELSALLERQAVAATPGALRLLRSDAQDLSPGDWGLSGLSAATTFYDLLRATYEALGREARNCYARLGDPPGELRILDQDAPRPLVREILAACLDAPVRPLRRGAPAAAGAALTAALALGLYPDPGAAAADWVTPHLEPPVPVDPSLRAAYAEVA